MDDHEVLDERINEGLMVIILSEISNAAYQIFEMWFYLFVVPEIIGGGDMIWPYYDIDPPNSLSPFCVLHIFFHQHPKSRDFFCVLRLLLQ